MWFLFRDIFAHPLRALLGLIGIVCVLGFALTLVGHASTGIQRGLGGILSLIPLLIVVGIFGGKGGVRWGWVIGAIVIAVLIAAVASLVASNLGTILALLLIVGLPILGMRQWWHAHVSGPRPPNSGSQWASIGQLRSAGFLQNVGWPVGTIRGRTIRLPAAKECEGVLAVAPTGTGKTSTLAVPAIISEAERGDLRSIIAGDPKGEITPLTLLLLAATHHAIVWSPSGQQGIPANQLVGWDPFRTLPKPSDPRYGDWVQDLSDCWFWATREGKQASDPIWITMPRSWMRVVFAAYLTGHPTGTFLGLADWVRSLSVDEFIAQVANSPSPSVRDKAKMLQDFAKSERAAGPLWADIQQRFDVLDSPSVRASMRAELPRIDWRAFIANPTALYVVVSAQDAERLQPLVSLFFATLSRVLVAIASYYGNRLPRGVRIFIDEFGNLPQIHGFHTSLATLRSANIGHYLFVQGRSQLRYHYGPDLAQTLEENLCTKIILGGAADEDARWFSARAGEYQEWQPTTSYGHSGIFSGQQVHRGLAPNRRPLVAASEIMHAKGVAFLSTSGLPPVWMTQRPYYTDAKLRERLQQVQAAPSAAPPIPPPPTPRVSGPPPAGCSMESWVNAPQSVQLARQWIDHDVMKLFTGMGSVEGLHQDWEKNWPQCSPAYVMRMSYADRNNAPEIVQYLQGFIDALQMANWFKSHPNLTLSPYDALQAPPHVPGCPAEEVAQAPLSVMTAFAYCKRDTLAWVRGTVDEEWLREQWSRYWPQSTPKYWQQISNEDAIRAPNVMITLRQSAYFLSLDEWLVARGEAPPSPLRGECTSMNSNYTDSEWFALPASMRAAQRSLSTDGFALVTAMIEPQKLQERWKTLGRYGSPGLIAAITYDEAQRYPQTFQEIREQAAVLRIDVPEPAAPAPIAAVPPAVASAFGEMSLPGLEEPFAADSASPVGSGMPALERRQRDRCPPGVSQEEYDAAPQSLLTAMWSFEDDLQDLVTGRVPNQEVLEQGWSADWPKCSPARWQKITLEDAKAAPRLYGYVRELARRLRIVSEL